jgi:hypothetical protein
LPIIIILAVGPQIYADGLVVLDRNGTAGRIGARHVIKHILEFRGGEWQNIPVSDIMDSSVCGIDAGSSLSYTLIVFDETRFAFVPITINYRIKSSFSYAICKGYRLHLSEDLSF